MEPKQERLCKKCNEVKPFSAFHKRKVDKSGVQSKCKECVKTYRKTYRENNKEKIMIYRKTYNETHKGERRVYDKAYSKIYYETHTEEIRAKNKAHYEAHREHHNAYSRAYAEAHKEDRRVYNRAYRQTHREKINAKDAKREAIKRQAILPTTDNELIINLYKQRVDMTEERGEQYHVDHIIPLSIGGAHHQDNLRVITATENMEKSNKYIPELGGVWADNELARETKRNHANEATKQIR